MAQERSALPTIVDVARAAGVSKGLVSFAFNNRPGVADETRDRILRIADELGWRPSLPARTLSTRTSFAMGLVIRRDPTVLTSDSFFPAFVAGVQSVLSTQSRALVLAVVDDAAAEEAAYRSLAQERRVDGIFLTDLRRGDARLALLDQLHMPAVTLGRPDEESPFPAVNMDDTTGIEQAVHHLAELGHTRIAHVAGDPELLHGRRRREAFEDAMTAHGLLYRSLVDTDFSPAAGAAATRTLLRRRPRPTAILYACDPMAMAGLKVLREHAVDVPSQMSIIGYDGSEIARYLHPALTTVEADPAHWGRAAAQTLLTAIADGYAADVELAAAHFVPGDSTAPVPAR